MSDYIEGLSLLPQHMRGGVQRYIEHGVPGGSFQEAVFSNQFIQAFNRADSENAAALHQWAEFLYNYAPSGCHGSPDKVQQWVEHCGLEMAGVE